MLHFSGRASPSLRYHLLFLILKEGKKGLCQLIWNSDGWGTPNGYVGLVIELTESRLQETDGRRFTIGIGRNPGLRHWSQLRAQVHSCLIVLHGY